MFTELAPASTFNVRGISCVNWKRQTPCEGPKNGTKDGPASTLTSRRSPSDQLSLFIPTADDPASACPVGAPPVISICPAPCENLNLALFAAPSGTLNVSSSER